MIKISNVEISETINETGSLFDSYYVFNLNYAPKTYQFRSGQFNKMKAHSRGLDFNENPSNMRLIGSCATGKTSVMKEYFKQVEEEYFNVVCIYIDCDSENTQYKIYSEFYKKLINSSTDINGWQFSKIKKEVMNYIIKKDIILIVGLDDYELIDTTEFNKILYSLLRAGEKHEGAKVSIVMASSDEGEIKLNNNVKTVFKAVEVYFPKYSQIEIFHILKQRAEEGFYPNVISDNVLNYIADQTFNTGDLRKGIDLLRRSGINAEEDNSSQISLKHVY